MSFPELPRLAAGLLTARSLRMLIPAGPVAPLEQTATMGANPAGFPVQRLMLVWPEQRND